MSEVISTEPTTPRPDSKHPVSTTGSEPAVEVFAVYGVEPEIQAYAMARYSRSSLSMKEALKEITLQKAEKFANPQGTCACEACTTRPSVGHFRLWRHFKVGLHV